MGVVYVCIIQCRAEADTYSLWAPGVYVCMCIKALQVGIHRLGILESAGCGITQYHLGLRRTELRQLLSAQSRRPSIRPVRDKNQTSQTKILYIRFKKKSTYTMDNEQ